jgi:putative Mn2+ efflux pump MntP
MDLLLLGMGMGVVGGLIPSPLHLIALAQVALNRWVRAIAILLGPPLLIDAVLLVIFFFFYRAVPQKIGYYMAYVGGVVIISFGTYALLARRGKTREEMADSSALTAASVTAAALSELAAPGTWIYWLTIAGPILVEGRLHGYWHVVPFFVGSVVGFYGASIVSVWLLSWGAKLHKAFNSRLFYLANVLLIILGISYLLRAHFGR